MSDEVLAAARVLAATGLVDAFGHVSARAGDRIVITPAVPLADVDRVVAVDPDAGELPAGAPREAWIHLGIYGLRSDVAAIARAQPAAVTAVGVSRAPLRALHGQGALHGREVPSYDDARLVRDRDRGFAVARALGAAPALILHGNGAVTVGSSPGIAAARMHVLEASARVNLAAGDEARLLSDDELAAWDAASEEILARLWTYLVSR